LAFTILQNHRVDVISAIETLPGPALLGVAVDFLINHGSGTMKLKTLVFSSGTWTHTGGLFDYYGGNITVTGTLTLYNMQLSAFGNTISGDARVIAEQKAAVDLGKIGFGIAMVLVIGLVIVITLFNFLRTDSGEDITWVG
jgi:hypothetical protein